jgi:hypothetical protein
MRTPRGHIRPHGAGHEEAVSVGLNPITKRYRYLGCQLMDEIGGAQVLADRDHAGRKLVPPREVEPGTGGR